MDSMKMLRVSNEVYELLKRHQQQWEKAGLPKPTLTYLAEQAVRELAKTRVEKARP